MLIPTTIDNVASLSTIAAVLGSLLMTDSKNSRVYIPVLVACMVIWFTGVLRVGEINNKQQPSRGKFIDRVMVMHISYIPMYFVFKRINARVNFMAIFAALASSVFVVSYATISAGMEIRDAMHLASRGVVFAVIIMLCFITGVGSDMSSRVLVLVSELLYMIAYVYLKPVGGDGSVSVAGMKGLEEVYTNVTGKGLGDIEGDGEEDPDACAPLCVVGKGEAACYEHNQMIDTLEKRAMQNREAGIPEMHGMTAHHRMCMRTHALGTRCTYCQQNGCVRKAIPGDVCYDSSDAFNRTLADSKEDSERLVEDGFGVLSLEDQLEHMQGLT